jgi:hypothetical protein
MPRFLTSRGSVAQGVLDVPGGTGAWDISFTAPAGSTTACRSSGSTRAPSPVCSSPSTAHEGVWSTA